MDKVEFEKRVRHEINGRIVDRYEILTYKEVMERYKLSYDFVLLAIQFAKIIKGNVVRLQYVLKIINDWVMNDIKTVCEAKVMLLNRHVYLKKKGTNSPNKCNYSGREMQALFDMVEEINL